MYLFCTLSIILLPLVNVISAAYDPCQVCKTVVNYVNSYKSLPYDDAFNKTSLLEKLLPQEQQQFFQDLTQYNFHKLYMDVNSGNAGVTAETTCADMGFCDFSLGFEPSFQIVDFTKYGLTNFTTLAPVRDKSIIVVHHTETPTLMETVQVLIDRGLSVQYIVDYDGGVYRAVNDYYRAWHAGHGIWNGDGCQYENTNLRSVGIEVVNSGDSPFPPAQVDGIHKLVSYLQQKWHVLPENIIAHHENGPDYKYDISGYFEWKSLYDQMGFYNDLWASNLTPDQMKTVLLDKDNYKQNPNLLLQVQLKLFTHGYGTLVLGDDYNSSNSSLVTTAMAVQSFNRKYAPEIFYKETIKNDDEVLDPRNQRVYAITMERLDKLLRFYQKVKPECTNYGPDREVLHRN